MIGQMSYGPGDEPADDAPAEVPPPERSAVADLAGRVVSDTEFDPVEVDPFDALPTGTAQLIVAAENPDSFQMTFYHNGAHESAPERSAAQLRKKLLTIPAISRAAQSQPDA